jgi:hypothetical protein
MTQRCDVRVPADFKAALRDADSNEMGLHLDFRWSGILQCVLLAVLALACGPPTLPEPPAELIGTWRTTTPGYERSYLRIERDRLTIGMGPFVLDDHPIVRIERSTEDSGDRVYELFYVADEGYADSIRVSTRPGVENALRIANRAEPWTRDP